MTAHQRLVNGRYTVAVPEHRAGWDALSDWERVRFASMEARLRPGMVLFDVGAEEGWQSAIYARFVGGAENVVLFEPSPQVWPCIRQTWLANGLAAPRAWWVGFVSDTTCAAPEGLDMDPGDGGDGWPRCSVGDVWPAMTYRTIPHWADKTPQITMDDWVQITRQGPQAVTIDVEGAEMAVLDGAVDTLMSYRPEVWVSIHPDLMARDFDDDPVELLQMMAECGYVAEFLGTDHEEHWLFVPAERA